VRMGGAFWTGADGGSSLSSRPVKWRIIHSDPDLSAAKARIVEFFCAKRRPGHRPRKPDPDGLYGVLVCVNRARHMMVMIFRKAADLQQPAGGLSMPKSCGRESGHQASEALFLWKVVAVILPRRQNAESTRLETAT